MTEFFRPSGGALFHLRALRRRRLWRAFAGELAAWLNAWPVSRRELVLIGPSAGYTLPSLWLSSFKTVHAYDLDPLAPWLFHRRHPGLRVKFHKADMFWLKDQLTTRPLAEAIQNHPHAVFLFCNVLGQIPLEKTLTESRWLEFLVELRTELEGSTWASYHDLYTLEPLPIAHHKTIGDDFKKGLEVSQAAQSAGATGLEIVDHLMAGVWSEGLEKAALAWSLTSRSLHLIEAVRTSALYSRLGERIQLTPPSIGKTIW